MQQTKDLDQDGDSSNVISIWKTAHGSAILCAIPFAIGVTAPKPLTDTPVHCACFRHRVAGCLKIGRAGSKSSISLGISRSNCPLRRTPLSLQLRGNCEAVAERSLTFHSMLGDCGAEIHFPWAERDCASLLSRYAMPHEIACPDPALSIASLDTPTTKHALNNSADFFSRRITARFLSRSMLKT
jgi:hypothetical protein